MMRDSTTRRSLAPSIGKISRTSCVRESTVGVGSSSSALFGIAMLASTLAAASANVDIAWTATERSKGGELKLLEEQTPLKFAPMPSKPEEAAALRAAGGGGEVGAMHRAHSAVGVKMDKAKRPEFRGKNT